MGVDFRSGHSLSAGGLGAPVESRTFLYNQLRYEKSDRNHTKGVEGIATLGPLVS